MKKILLVLTIILLSILNSCGIDNEDKVLSENHTKNLKRIDAIIKHNELKPDYVFKDVDDFYDKLEAWSITDYNDKIIQIKNTKDFEKREDYNSFYWEDKYNFINNYYVEIFPNKKTTKLPKSIIGYFIINSGDWYENTSESGINIQLHGVQEYNGGKK